MTRRLTMAHVLGVAVAAIAMAACGVDSGVSVGESQQLADAPTSDGPSSTDDPPTTDDEPPQTIPDPPTSTAPPRSADDLIVGAEGKPQRPHDQVVELAVADLDHWWSEMYPQVYGQPYESLQGGVNPAYPERTEPIPGCTVPPSDETTYEEMMQAIAFYCPDGDFIAYDEGENGFLMNLVSKMESTSVFPVVIAHEWGHAIQARNGDLTRQTPTIVTEQQADCFAGAWVERAVSGEAGGISFTEADVQVAMSSLIAVRDPIGYNQMDPGGHGSGFDRVNAFQVGYLNGVERCSELIDEPLELVPNTFAPGSDPSRGGNAPWGYDEERNEILGFLPNDMNDYWQGYFEGAGGEQFPELELVPVESGSEVDCPDADADVTVLAVYCPDTNEVFFPEATARQLYDRFGDFAMGYVFGNVWAEAAQQLWDSPLEGEDRALINDCLAGAYSADVIPDETGQTRREGAVIEPGDLDEAILTAIMLSDKDPGDNQDGTAFEKVDHYRDGVLNGVDACNARLQSGD